MQRKVRLMLKKEQIIFLIAIICLGLFYKVMIVGDNRDFWHDEAFQVVYSEKSIPFLMDSTDVHPPLYNIITHYIVGITKDIFLLRLTSVFFSIIFIIMFYITIKELFNDRIAMFSTTAISFCYTYIYYATEFRNYSFVLMLTIIQIYFFNKMLKDEKYLYVYTAFSVLMIYSHYLSALIIFVQFLHIIYVDIRTSKRIDYNSLNSYLLMFVLSIPLMFYLFNTLPKLQSFWFHDIDFISFISTFYYILTPPSDYHYGFAFFYILLFATMFIYRKEIDDKYIQFAMYLFLPVMIMWTISQFIPFYHHRYFLFGGIGFFVLLGWGVDKINRRIKDIDLYFLAIWIVLFLCGMANFVTGFDHEIQHSAKFMQNETINMTDVCIIHTSTFSQTPYKVYLPDAKNYLMTGLSEKILFTAGGSAINEGEIIRKMSDVNCSHTYSVSERQFFRWTIFEEGGLYVTTD